MSSTAIETPNLLLIVWTAVVSCAGARGGRAEFSWENVKSDKDREYYLGHSVKASVGRWQKGELCCCGNALLLLAKLEQLLLLAVS